MSKLLRIDASARLEGSQSRTLADQFVTQWTKHHPGAQVVLRDVAREPVPHISQDTIAGMFGTPGAPPDATALSDRLIGELRDAEALLISTPMYNFSVPSGLKAWIDQVVRIGQTFAFDGQRFNGLLPGRVAYVICVYGTAGYGEGGDSRAANHLEPYLRTVLNFLGIADLTFFAVEATSTDPAKAAAGVAAARADFERLLPAR